MCEFRRKQLGATRSLVQEICVRLAACLWIIALEYWGG